jgi:hypothetical protein
MRGNIFLNFPHDYAYRTFTRLQMDEEDRFGHNSESMKTLLDRPSDD